MTPTTKPAADKKARQRKEHRAVKLDALIEEATVDAYDESEQTAGFDTMLEDHLAMPFSTEVLGMEVTVERIDMTDDEEIVAVYARGRCGSHALQSSPGMIRRMNSSNKGTVNAVSP